MPFLASEQASQEPQTIKITTAQGYKRSKLLEIQAEEAQEFLLLSSFLSQKPEPSPVCVRGHFCLFRDAFSASLLLETNVRRLKSESSHTPRFQLFFFFFKACLPVTSGNLTFLAQSMILEQIVFMPT